ncbi:MAG: Holliday junction resolvase RuvX [Brevibacterium aurantiacum]|uniref:Holliday junction resolvase RuvX n=1 Tax=Brevibacterium aurantiacum TaxID=273384 RepID=UPI001866A874|nr:Holliday junction resolvase RuvX [Brevibacterium aurantiacum]MDN5549098.1 Holliday junction resolvase RuvX [Brevibacterium sp.]MDN5772225.1 Holliday junction resolvase RuvX [Brevibacterium aurantiacum]
MSFRRGRRLGLDIGSVRIGVAASDPDGILATPLTVVRRTDEPAALKTLREIIDEYEPIELLIGDPKSLDGSARAAAATALEFARRISVATATPIRLVDERFTTVEAHHALAAAGKNSRQRREIVDAQAAVIILQNALEYEHNTGQPAGRAMPDEESEQ